MEDWIEMTENDYKEYMALMEERPEKFIQNDNLKIILDIDEITEFEKENNRKLGVVYKSAFNILVVDLVEANGNKFAYERVLPAIVTPAGVAIPVFSGKFVLLKQFRHAPRKTQLAFPRGFATEGLSPAQNIVKEIVEETGAAIMSTTKVGSIMPDSGLTASSADVFLVDIGYPDGNVIGHEGIESFEFMSLEELREAARNEELNDGFTMAALFLYESALVKGLVEEVKELD